jgi:UDP-N-acetylglucosamine 4,6-dehydratase
MLTSMNPESYLIFGGTGSLGQTLVQRLLEKGDRVVVFSRDEAKHYNLRLRHPKVESIIGDIRNPDAVFRAIHTSAPRYIINAAAMKQIPICEEFPYEAVLTNTLGTQHVLHAIYEYQRTHPAAITAVSISTDKACEPISSYGMTKALQERMHIGGNRPDKSIFTAVRYGNVLNSTGSVIPVFQDHIARGQTLTITDPATTRFLFSLDEAVDLIFHAIAASEGGTIFIPKIKAATLGDLAECIIEASGKKVEREITRARAGDKLHETLISEDERLRTEDCGDYFRIHPLASGKKFDHVTSAYRSNNHVMNKAELGDYLRTRGSI